MFRYRDGMMRGKCGPERPHIGVERVAIQFQTPKYSNTTTVSSIQDEE